MKAINLYFWYLIRSFKAKVYLKNSSKITVFLVTNVEINVISKKLIKEANLAIRQGSKIEFVFYTSDSRLFSSLCKDIEIAIKRLKTRHLIFLIKAGNHDFVLSQPFLNSIKFS